MDRCIVCDGCDSEPLYDGILKCRTCGYVFADTGLDDEEIAGLYGNSYFFGEEYSDYLSDRRAIQKNFRLRFRVLSDFLTPAHRHLLEIGSAYGFFLDIARHHFDRVQGIDIAADAVRYAQGRLGLDVVRADFLDHDFGGCKFDVVCLWDTIEHLRSPDLYLEKMGRHTEAGALLAITTGDIGSLNARFKKDRWRLLHPPTHLHYFSKKTLGRLLDRYGFDVVYCRYSGFYRSIDNAAHNVFVLRRQKPGPYSLLQRCGITGLDFYLNLYDIMYIIARKR